MEDGLAPRSCAIAACVAERSEASGLTGLASRHFGSRPLDRKRSRIWDTLALLIFEALRPKNRKASSWRLHGLVIGLKQDGDIG